MGSESGFWQRVVTAFLLAQIIGMHDVSGTSYHTHEAIPKIFQYSETLPGQKFMDLAHVADHTHHARTIYRRGRDLTYSDRDDTSRREVDALIVFKESVTNDPSGALKSWVSNDTDACSWTGVRCSPSSSNVADLDLRNLGLVGSMPEMIGHLNFLEHLDLSNNFLSGSISTSIANCSNLSYLNISENQLMGEIPSEVGELFQLRTLVASENNLTGVIPTAIGNLSVLEILVLRNNFLEGAMPVTLGELSTLKQLVLEENVLSGTIPNALGNCSYLTLLALNKNYALGGELPEELGLLQKMESFWVHSCNFGGAFPVWVSNFTSLISFDLNDNSFTGKIPEEIGKLSENLTELVLYGNLFTGKIPLTISNCTRLVWFEVNRNQMTGDIPPAIGFLSSLEVLNLNINSFSGLIPASISNCSALRYLAIGDNIMSRQTIPAWLASLPNLVQIFLTNMNLYGQIPASLGQLSNLERLIMYYNDLGGVLPASLGNLSILSVLELEFNQFQGEIPVEITGNLSFLTYFQLGGNFLVGSFPKLRSLNELIHFDIEFNSFTGNIDSNALGVGAPLLESFYVNDNNFSEKLPHEIGNFSNIQTLSFSSNSFTGSIPALWANLTNLAWLNIGFNKLEGMIPTTLFTCIQLEELYLGSNQFKGSIPDDIGQLVNLRELGLENNFLSGVLPSSFANFTSMRTMKLSHNRIRGVISGNAFSRMASTSLLDISHNFISGSLPAELQLLTHIQYLDVSSNNISGSIPRGLATCIELAYLDISVNNLTGTLPADLGLLRYLQFFNASRNDFYGPIPASGLFLTNNITKFSFLGNPRLCGSTRLVSRQCSNLSVSAHHHCKAFNCRSIWIPVVATISGLLFLGIAILSWWGLAHHKNTGGDMLTEFILQGRIVLSKQAVMAIIEGGDVIGMGANSVVYRGMLPGGEIFALKVLRNKDTDHDGSGTERLLREVHTLAQLRHVNIVKVLGLSVTPDVKGLILEYVPGGSLYDLLYSNDEVCSISQQQRFKIILGVAESLFYLHHSFHEPIIHRDVKPSNILLGLDLEPKLGDFGISKFGKLHTQEDVEASASTICGTFGYIPPEYASQPTVSAKGDVYSFGVVLLELLTGKKPASESSSTENGDLVQLVHGPFKEKPLELLDSALMEEGTVNHTAKNQLMLLLRVGRLCTTPAPESRPSMKDVVGMLKQVNDYGGETKTFRTVEELANEIGILDPVSAGQPGDQVTSSSS